MGERGDDQTQKKRPCGWGACAKIIQMIVWKIRHKGARRRKKPVRQDKPWQDKTRQGKGSKKIKATPLRVA